MKVLRPLGGSNAPKSRVVTEGGSYFSSPKKDVIFIPSGSTELDLALGGGGWARNRIINIVGDKCLSGDTIVSVKRGTAPRRITIQQLFNLIKGNHFNKKEHTTYLVADIGGFAGTAKMLDIVMSGNKMLYEITNEKGDKIKASKDHKFFTADTCVPLEDLRVGDLLKCWRGTRGSSTYIKKKRDYTYSIQFHPFGQHNIVAGKDYKCMLTARLVIEAAINGVDLQELIYILRKDAAKASTLSYTDPSLEVHHLDGDPTNDDVNNLCLLTPEEHWEIHANEMPKATKALETSKITSIKKVGVEPTFDITMEAPYHNFIANNFVVHNSTGKTLLCIEAAANFAKMYPKGKIRYRESEKAFINSYAQALGMPINRVDFGERIKTVEELFNDITHCIDKATQQELYIVDSLDALSDADELERGFGENTYGTKKAKLMSELFRRIDADMQGNMTLIIVSQVRDNISTMPGQKKFKRSGGRALDFYASQVVALSYTGKIYRTVNKIKRVVGIGITASLDKNKIGLPARNAKFEILFGWGIDDIKSCLNFLLENGGIPKHIDIPKNEIKAFCLDMVNGKLDYKKEADIIHQAVIERWWQIEDSFMPKRSKYGE